MMLLDSLAVPHQPTGITTFAGEVVQFAHPSPGYDWDEPPLNESACG